MTGFVLRRSLEVDERKVARRVAAQHTPSRADCNLSASLDSINSVRSHMRALQQRFRVIENSPGGRAQLLPQERIEYDSIGALLSDLRAAVAQAEKGGAT